MYIKLNAHMVVFQSASLTHDWQVPPGHFSADHSCRRCVVASERATDVLGQLSCPPSSRLPPTLAALRDCVTLLKERA